jgi:predicted kinase
MRCHSERTVDQTSVALRRMGHPTNSADGPARRALVLVTGLQGTGKSTIANAAAAPLGAAVLSHDWAMSGLRPFPAIQNALDCMEPPGHRPVGWSVLRALAREQLRRGAAVVLDGVARAREIDECRALAKEETARFVLVVTDCSDRELHRSRVEARQRSIPAWYELDWPHAERAIVTWQTIEDPHLVLDASASLNHNLAALADLLDNFD